MVLRLDWTVVYDYSEEEVTECAPDPAMSSGWGRTYIYGPMLDLEVAQSLVAEQRRLGRMAVLPDTSIVPGWDGNALHLVPLTGVIKLALVIGALAADLPRRTARVI
jgi:hypothetical protein